jgi:stress-induced morphogen
MVSNAERVKLILSDKYGDENVHIFDPRDDDVHLEAVVISKTFEAKSILQQQREVMSILTDEFNNSLHALALKTYTPERWNKVNNTLK